MNFKNTANSKRLVLGLIGASVALVFLTLYNQQTYRVGDGSEYIAMYFGWSVEQRPWLSQVSFTAYDAYLKSGEILGGVQSEALKNAFPALSTIHGQWDFNHFWFYSLAAYLCQAVFTFGNANSPEIGFLLLHALLAFWLLRTSYIKFGRSGLLASTAISISSPIIWFIFAIHTEFWTFTLTSLAVIHLLAGEKTKASLFLALVSTQNPSFAILAAALFLWEVQSDRAAIRKPGFWVISIAAASISILHPMYYLIRYGAPTPQSIAGGLNPGVNLDTWYIWFIDPDIGLLPNWPLGALAAGIGLFSLLRRGRVKIFTNIFKISVQSFSLFAFIFVAVSVYAQSGTTNLNSGATPGIARYAIWYVCLFIPIFIYLIEQIQNRGRLYISIAVSTILVFTGINLIQNFPLKFESYSNPSPQGLFVQRYLSGFYNSPPEIFAERYSGAGEAIWGTNITAVLGPDCRKILVIKKSLEPVLSNNFDCKLRISSAYFTKLLDQNEKTGNFYVVSEAVGD